MSPFASRVIVIEPEPGRPIYILPDIDFQRIIEAMRKVRQQPPIPKPFPTNQPTQNRY